METLQQSFESTAEYFSGSECLLAVLSRTETEHFKQRYCWVDDDSQAKGMSLWTCLSNTDSCNLTNRQAKPVARTEGRQWVVVISLSSAFRTYNARAHSRGIVQRCQHVQCCLPLPVAGHCCLPHHVQLTDGRTASSPW